MKYILLIPATILFLSVFSALSCTKDTCDISLEEEQKVSCDVDLEPSISFDTLWYFHQPENINRRVFDKYFGIFYSASKTVEIFSNVDHAKVSSFDVDLFYHDFEDGNVEMIDDYFYYFDNTQIHRVNVLTGEETVSDTILSHSSILFQTESFFYIRDGYLMENDYNLSQPDTLDYFPILNYPHLNSKMVLFKYPEPYNTRYMIITNSGPSPDFVYDRVFSFFLYNLDKGSLADNYITSSEGLIRGFKIEDYMVHVSTNYFHFVYDLRNLKHFEFLTSKYYPSSYLSGGISEIKGANDDLSPMVFFNNDGLQAYRFYTRDLVWSCTELASNFHPLYLSDSKGDVHKYISFLQNGNLCLADPENGIVRAKYKVKEYIDNEKSNISYFSSYQNKDETILFTDEQIFKLKINKQ